MRKKYVLNDNPEIFFQIGYFWDTRLSCFITYELAWENIGKLTTTFVQTKPVQSLHVVIVYTNAVQNL